MDVGDEERVEDNCTTETFCRQKKRLDLN